MARLYDLPIRALLPLIVFVVVLPAAGIIIHTGIKLRKEAFDQACKDTQKIVAVIEMEQRHLVRGAQQLMTALAGANVVFLDHRGTILSRAVNPQKLHLEGEEAPYIWAEGEPGKGATFYFTL